MLNVGEKAPEFTLADRNGQPVSLSDFAGKRVVLYFYPRDNTPGCTRQACAFARLYEEFQALNAVVVGISKDSAASHDRFAQKYGLPFVLLSDPELLAIQADQEEHLIKQIMSLPFSESQTIILRYYRNMKIEEIAKMMDISVSSVKRYLQSGRNMLAKSIER